jgi:hypothetical protein
MMTDMTGMDGMMHGAWGIGAMVATMAGSALLGIALLVVTVLAIVWLVRDLTADRRRSAS